jgi:hypothetical protein
MRAALITLAAFAWLADTSACEQPSLVEIPSAAGLSWNKYETLIPALQAYFDDMRAYVGCLANEIDSAESAPDGEQRFAALLTARNNAAVEESQTVMALYRALQADLQALEESSEGE